MTERKKDGPVLRPWVGYLYKLAPDLGWQCQAFIPGIGAAGQTSHDAMKLFRERCQEQLGRVLPIEEVDESSHGR